MGRWAIINGLLGLLVVGLGFGLASTWTRQLPPVEVVEHPAEAAPAATPGKGGGKGKRGGPDKGGPRGDPPPAVLVNTIVDKDLFDVSRTKPTEEAKAAPPVPKETGPPSGVTIVGVQILGRNREAFVNDASAPPGSQQRRLHVGDQISGYTVKGIDVDGVELTSPSGDAVTMALSIEKKGATAAAGKPPVPPVAGRPGQPGQPPSSPAAGVGAATSPAAGVGAKPVAPPVPPAMPPRPGQPGAAPPMPGQAQPGVPPAGSTDRPKGRLGRGR